MQPGFYGQNPAMTGPCAPGMGMYGGGMPYTPPMGMPFGGMPFTPPTGMPFGPMMGPTMGTFTAPFGTFHCPVCGYSGPVWHTGPSPASFGMGFYGYPYTTGFGGLGGMRTHGGTYTPQFAATGLPTDEEITEMIYDGMDIDPLIPYDADINVTSDAGIVTLTGSVPDKAAKHAAGDDTWWVPGVTDVKNEITVTGEHRFRAAPERRKAPTTRRPTATKTTPETTKH